MCVYVCACVHMRTSARGFVKEEVNRKTAYVKLWDEWKFSGFF